jgi:hypothetical protein
MKCPNCEDEIKLEYGTKPDSTMQYQYWWCNGCEKKVDPTQGLLPGEMIITTPRSDLLDAMRYFNDWAGQDTWLDEVLEPQMRTNKGED